MIFYGLDAIIDEFFAKEEECFPLRFEEEALVVAYTNQNSAAEAVRKRCESLGIGAVKLLEYPSHEIQRLIHNFYAIELKEKEIYRRIRSYIQADAFEDLFFYLVDAAKRLGASDIHIAAENNYCFIRFRIHGRIKTFSVIEAKYLDFLCRVIKVKGNMDLARTLKPVDARITVSDLEEDIDIRVAMINTIAGEKITLRLLNNENVPKSIAALGISAEDERLIRQSLEKSAGTILVTGPTGSGKSTTVRCFLNEINRGESHIITVEDPIEYRMDGITQIQVEEKNHGFTQAVKSVLRQDPDVIFIGEIRDEVSADVATKASITGHLVFSTLHTGSAAAAIERMEGLGIDKRMMMNSLLLVINQRLIAEQCPECLKPFTHAGEEISALGLRTGDRVYESIGCKFCDYSGVSRRVPLMSMVVFDEETKAAVLGGEGLNSKGIQSALKNKFSKKEISLAEAKRFL